MKIALVLLLACTPAASECVTYDVTGWDQGQRNALWPVVAHYLVARGLGGSMGEITVDRATGRVCASGIAADQFPTADQYQQTLDAWRAEQAARTAADAAAHQAYEDAVSGSPVCLATAAQVETYYENLRTQLSGATQAKVKNGMIDDAKRQALCFVWLRNRLRQGQ